MTNKQFEELEIGDIVTRTSGPNKDILMKVTAKGIAGSSYKWIEASGVEPNTVYNQRKWARNANWTSGSISCFKLVRRTNNYEGS